MYNTSIKCASCKILKIENIQSEYRIESIKFCDKHKRDAFTLVDL